MAVNGYEACCMNCRFWKRLEAGKAGGNCRRNPPTLLVMLVPHPSQNSMVQVADTKFPIAFDTGWCGEHQTDVGHTLARQKEIDLSKLALEDEELDPA